MLKIGTSSKRKLTVCSFLIVFLSGAIVPAEMQLFPMWKRKACPTEEFACYDFSTAKKIVKIDLDLQLKLKEFELLKTKFTNLETAYGKLNAANMLLQHSIERLEKRNKEKQQVLETTTAALKKAEAQSVWNYLPWIVTGAVVLTGAGFGVGYYLGTR